MKLGSVLLGLVVAMAGCTSGGGVNLGDPLPCDLPCGPGGYECRYGDLFVQRGELQSDGMTPCPGDSCSGKDGVDDYACCHTETVEMFRGAGVANPWALGCHVTEPVPCPGGACECMTEENCEADEACLEDADTSNTFCARSCESDGDCDALDFCAPTTAGDFCLPRE